MIRLIILMCIGFGSAYAADFADSYHSRLLQLKIERNLLEQELLGSQVRYDVLPHNVSLEARSPRDSDRVIKLAWENVGLSDASINSCRMQIVSKITAEENATDYWWINLDLSANYITSQGVKELADFVIGNDDLKYRLVKIDLSNNHIQADGLTYVKAILEICPYVKIFMNINNIGVSDVERVFSGKSAVLMERFQWKNNA